ncbi:unnamed protein product, partial [Staurois parvus]
MGTGGWHWWVALLGTGGWNWWVALLGTDHQGTDHQCLMIGADPCSDNCQFSAVLSPRSDSVRKVQPRTGNC